MSADKRNKSEIRSKINGKGNRYQGLAGSTRVLSYLAGLLGAAALILGIVTPLPLQASEPPVKKVYTTHPVNPHNPVIDGRLDDPAWDKVEWASDFIQREPHEGKPPTEPTSFKILYDEKNLYIAIRAHDKEPDKIVERLVWRDNVDGDWVDI